MLGDLSVIAFWGAGGLILYTYVVFPLLVLIRGRRSQPYEEADVTPTVGVVVAAHDEAASICGRIQNLLRQDYPPERLEIVVVSDGSTDATAAIARRCAEDDRVQVLDLPRVGKARALTAGVERVGGEIVAFTDANTTWQEGALRALVRPFADPDVGGVAGDQRYVRAADATAIASGEERYWDIDRRLKQAQSAAGSVTSATGALYAIRRDLFDGVADGVTDDFHISTGVVAAGRRLVFARDAVAVEPVAARGRVEFRRKVRIMTRGLRAVRVRGALLNPRVHGFYSLQLFSHKVLRRVVVLPLLVLAFATAGAWSAGPFYRGAALAQVLFYGAAALGASLPHARGRLVGLLQLPAYFCLVNAAAIVALVNLARGVRIDRWAHDVRATPVETASDGSSP